MPTIALFYPRNACLLFNRVTLCAICTGLASTVLTHTNPTLTHHSLVDLLLQLADLVPPVLHQAALLRKEGGRAPARLPHQASDLTPLHAREVTALETQAG